MGGRPFLIKVRSVIAVLIGMLVLVGGVSAATVTVCSSGCDYTSIQGAVNAASNGDTISVDAGTYTENVDIATSVNLVGAGAGVTTVQAASSSDHVFEVTADWVNISGFTVTGVIGGWPYSGIYLNGVNYASISNNNASNNMGGGIYIESSSSNTIANNIANSNDYYHGIYLNSSSSNTITNNTATSNDYWGIFLRNSSSNTITNNTATSNNAMGIFLRESGNNTVANNNASLNERGIILFLGSHYNTVTNNLVTYNNRAGIKLNATSTYNNLSNNIASNNNKSGIVLAVGSNYNIISNNTVNSNKKSGIRVKFASTYNNITNNTANSNNNHGIYLDNSSNNTITNNNANSNVEQGIKLNLSDSNTISDNTVSSNERGVRLFTSHYNTVTNNIATYNNRAGIKLNATSTYNNLSNNIASNNNKSGIVLAVGSNYNTISNNTVNSNKKSGIRVKFASTYNNITDNTANSNNNHGIYLDNSSNYNTITDNNASNNNHGIYLGSSSNNAISNNNVSSNSKHGIHLHDSGSNIITNNTAKENGHYDVYVEASSDAHCNNIVENNTVSGNWPLKYFNYTVTLEDEILSELILCNADNSTINNVTIEGSATEKNNGVWIVRTDDSSFTNINSSSNWDGIHLWDSDSNTIANNTASNNYHGIRLTSSDSNTISNNTASSNNKHGVRLSGSSNNTIANNTASNSTWDGIYLGSSSNYNIITNSTASNNGKGICLGSSSNYNTLTGNTVNSNRVTGIYLNSSSNNTIYNNYFNNTNNAYDDGSNYWNITETSGINIIGGPNLGGNYWSDYAGSDTTWDGLGDTSLPYNSGGNIATGGDWLPLTTVGGSAANQVCATQCHNYYKNLDITTDFYPNVQTSFDGYVSFQGLLNDMKDTPMNVTDPTIELWYDTGELYGGDFDYFWKVQPAIWTPGYAFFEFSDMHVTNSNGTYGIDEGIKNDTLGFSVLRVVENNGLITEDGNVTVTVSAVLNESVNGFISLDARLWNQTEFNAWVVDWSTTIPSGSNDTDPNHVHVDWGTWNETLPKEYNLTVTFYVEKTVPENITVKPWISVYTRDNLQTIEGIHGSTASINGTMRNMNTTFNSSNPNLMWTLQEAYERHISMEGGVVESPLPPSERVCAAQCHTYSKRVKGDVFNESASTTFTEYDVFLGYLNGIREKALSVLDPVIELFYDPTKLVPAGSEYDYYKNSSDGEMIDITPDYASLGFVNFTFDNISSGNAAGVRAIDEGERTSNAGFNVTRAVENDGIVTASGVYTTNVTVWLTEETNWLSIDLGMRNSSEVRAWFVGWSASPTPDRNETRMDDDWTGMNFHFESPLSTEIPYTISVSYYLDKHVSGDIIYKPRVNVNRREYWNHTSLAGNRTNVSIYNSFFNTTSHYYSSNPLQWENVTTADKRVELESKGPDMGGAEVCAVQCHTYNKWIPGDVFDEPDATNFTRLDTFMGFLDTSIREFGFNSMNLSNPIIGLAYDSTKLVPSGSQHDYYKNSSDWNIDITPDYSTAGFVNFTLPTVINANATGVNAVDNGDRTLYAGFNATRAVQNGGVVTASGTYTTKVTVWLLNASDHLRIEVNVRNSSQVKAWITNWSASPSYDNVDTWENDDWSSMSFNFDSPSYPSRYEVSVSYYVDKLVSYDFMYKPQVNIVNQEYGSTSSGLYGNNITIEDTVMNFTSTYQNSNPLVWETSNGLEKRVEFKAKGPDMGGDEVCAVQCHTYRKNLNITTDFYPNKKTSFDRYETFQGLLNDMKDTPMNVTDPTIELWYDTEELHGGDFDYFRKVQPAIWTPGYAFFEFSDMHVTNSNGTYGIDEGIKNDTLGFSVLRVVENNGLITEDGNVTVTVSAVLNENVNGFISLDARLWNQTEFNSWVVDWSTSIPPNWNNTDPDGVNVNFDTWNETLPKEYNLTVTFYVDKILPANITLKPHVSVSTRHNLQRTPGIYGSNISINGTLFNMSTSFTSSNSNLTWTAEEAYARRISMEGGVAEILEPYARFGFNKDFKVKTENDTITSGTYERNIKYHLNIDNRDDASDTVLGDLKFSAQAINITKVDWQEYAVWDENSVNWTFPSDFVIHEHDGHGTGFKTNYSETNYLNVNVSRWMNQTEFSSDGYQLAKFNVTFNDTNFEWVWARIEANERREIKASIVPGTFTYDAPLNNFNEWGNGVHFDFDKEQIQTGVTYNFSVVVKVELTGNEAPPILYKPEFGIGEGLFYNSTVADGYTVEMPSFILPDYVSYASATTNVSNAWRLERNDHTKAVLKEVVELAGPRARLEVEKGSGVVTYNDSIVSGTYVRNQYYQVRIRNSDDASDTTLGEIEIDIQASNVTHMGNDFYSSRNGDWWNFTFPSSQYLGEEEEQRIGSSRFSPDIVDLGISISRQMNNTVFSSNGYQLVNGTITFENLDFELTGANLDAKEYNAMSASIVPGTWFTDAPISWENEGEHGINFGFDKDQIQTGVTYNFSVVIKVDLTNNEGFPIIYKPTLMVFRGNMTATSSTSGYTAVVPQPVLPDGFDHVSATTNTSNSWQIQIGTSAYAILLDVVMRNITDDDSDGDGILDWLDPFPAIQENSSVSPAWNIGDFMNYNNTWPGGGAAVNITVTGITAEQGQELYNALRTSSFVGWNNTELQLTKPGLNMYSQKGPYEEEHLANPSHDFVNFPLLVGKSWEFNETTRGRHVFNVTGMEIVTTPAGSFNSYIIEEKTYDRQGRLSEHQKVWYPVSTTPKWFVKWEKYNSTGEVLESLILNSFSYTSPPTITNVTFSISSYKERVGRNITIPVTMNTTTNVGSIQLDFLYDSSVINATNVAQGSAASGALFTYTINNSAGRITIGIISVSGLSTDGSIADISFNVTAIGGNFTDLTLVNQGVTDPVNNELAVTLYHGNLTVYYYIVGDVTGDDRITAADALMYLRFAVGQPVDNINPIDDVTCDGRITAADALRVLRKAVGQPVDLEECPWI